MLLYSLLDKKAGSYGGIMMAPNDAMLVRTIIERVESRDTLARFPDDFDLYQVGEFDDSSGRVFTENGARFVCNMATVLQRKDDRQVEFAFGSAAGTREGGVI